MTVGEPVLHMRGTHGYITRSADHRYTYEGITYPGVTTILGSLDKSGPLMGWAARETATAAVRLLDELPKMLETAGPDGVVKLLTSRSSWTRDEAAQLGTDVHALAEMIVNGQPIPSTITETQRKRAEHYATWWTASGWVLRLAEAMVVRPDTEHEQAGWGGTFDLLAYDKDGRTVLADVKTGKAVYKEAVLQMAAYGLATLVQPAGSQKTYPMPLPERYVILHVTGDGVREVEVAIGTPERMAFLACLELYHWIESMKGKKL
jgi:hypothetical protein